MKPQLKITKVMTTKSESDFMIKKAVTLDGQTDYLFGAIAAVVVINKMDLL